MKQLNEKNTHLGANLDNNFVFQFRNYCRDNDFKQKTLIRRLLEWWLNLDLTNQEHIYRGRLEEIILSSTEKQTKKTEEINIIECIETVKHFVKFKIPSAEEQRMIASLRQILGPEPKQKRKEKKG